MTPRYPVLLRLEGEPVLVVGGGPVGERKVLGLLGVGATVTLVAPTATDLLRAAAADGAIRWESRRYGSDDASAVRSGAYRFLVAATGDPAVDDQVARDAAAGGTWANLAASPDGGPAAIPAVHRDGLVTVAVATGGAHPGAARWLRDQVARAIPAEVAGALDLLDEVLADRAASGSPTSRPDWREVIDSGTLDLIREGRKAEAKERLQACLSSSSD